LYCVAVHKLKDFLLNPHSTQQLDTYLTAGMGLELIRLVIRNRSENDLSNPGLN
jgi:hypothetical protein